MRTLRPDVNKQPRLAAVTKCRHQHSPVGGSNDACESAAVHGDLTTSISCIRSNPRKCLSPSAHRCRRKVSEYTLHEDSPSPLTMTSSIF